MPTLTRAFCFEAMLYRPLEDGGGCVLQSYPWRISVEMELPREHQLQSLDALLVAGLRIGHWLKTNWEERLLIGQDDKDAAIFAVGRRWGRGYALMRHFATCEDMATYLLLVVGQDAVAGTGLAVNYVDISCSVLAPARVYADARMGALPRAEVPMTQDIGKVPDDELEANEEAVTG